MPHRLRKRELLVTVTKSDTIPQRTIELHIILLQTDLKKPYPTFRKPCLSSKRTRQPENPPNHHNKQAFMIGLLQEQLFLFEVPRRNTTIIEGLM